MTILWDPSAWADYQHWAQTDIRVWGRINVLLGDIQQGGNLGEPFPVTDPAGYEVRRITMVERLVYRVQGDDVVVASCRHRHGQ